MQLPAPAPVSPPLSRRRPDELDLIVEAEPPGYDTIVVLSNRRIDVGEGQSYAVHEFAGLGTPLTERLGRFREGLDVVDGLWTNEQSSYSGEHYQVTDVRLMPKLVQ